MTRPRHYGSPAAFRRALTDRLRDASRSSRWTLAQLQRQIAYDRLLERLYLIDEGWVVKGATALLARDIGVRATIDLDVYREAAREVAGSDLREAAELDIGDWFRFEIGPPRAAGAAEGVRFPVRAFVGDTPWADFHLDLVGPNLSMTGQPDRVPPLARVVIPDIEQHGYRAYPLVDHIADKVTAIFERHGATGMPSTRYKDLVDLVAISLVASVDADLQVAALRSEARRRGVDLPPTFDVPDRDAWERGYRAEAARSLLTIASTLDEALLVVRRFIDPVLRETAHGAWDPGLARWA